MKRTPRRVYSNQQEIKNKILQYLKQKIFLSPFVNKVYLYGSLIDSQFGVYIVPEKNMMGEIDYGSDVDLIILADENFAPPKDWPGKEDYIFEFYDFGFINGIEGIKDGIHKITAFIYRKSLESLKIANKHNLKGDVFETKTRKEALDFWLKNHKNELWYKKEK